MLWTRIRALVRQQWAGLIALFLVLSGGSAWALDGSNTVFSDDIVNGEVKSADLGPNSVGSGKINDGGVHLPDLAGGSVDSAKVVNSSIGNLDLAGNSVNTPKVVNDSLFGVDIREDTLNPLDAHDAFDARCDPTSLTFVNCAGVEFFLQRSMPVLAIFNWAQYSDNDVGDRVAGICRTRLDGNNTSGDIWVGSESASGQTWRTAATPVVDVLTLPAGTHTLQLACSQNLRDIVFGDIRIAAVELGAD